MNHAWRDDDRKHKKDKTARETIANGNQATGEKASGRLAPASKATPRARQPIAQALRLTAALLDITPRRQQRRR